MTSTEIACGFNGPLPRQSFGATKCIGKYLVCSLHFLQAVSSFSNLFSKLRSRIFFTGQQYHATSSISSMSSAYLYLQVDCANIYFVRPQRVLVPGSMLIALRFRSYRAPFTRIPSAPPPIPQTRCRKDRAKYKDAATITPRHVFHIDVRIHRQTLLGSIRSSRLQFSSDFGRHYYKCI